VSWRAGFDEKSENLIPKHMPHLGHQKKTRGRFVFWFLAAGFSVPVILIATGYIVGTRIDWSPEGILGTTLLILTWILWPTWVFMMDSEHPSQIAFMLIIAGIFNSVYYGIVGILVWHLRVGLKSMRRKSDSESGRAL
jgi:hypothetical protein